MRSVKFLRSAQNDIRKEKAFYRAINPALALQFQSAVETAVQSIAMQPLAMQILDHEVRRWPLEAFPHGILYRDTDECVLILAVFHPSQSPEKWQSRARA